MKKNNKIKEFGASFWVRKNCASHSTQTPEYHTNTIDAFAETLSARPNHRNGAPTAWNDYNDLKIK